MGMRPTIVESLVGRGENGLVTSSLVGEVPIRVLKDEETGEDIGLYRFNSYYNTYPYSHYIQVWDIYSFESDARKLVVCEKDLISGEETVSEFRYMEHLDLFGSDREVEIQKSMGRM